MKSEFDKEKKDLKSDFAKEKKDMLSGFEKKEQEIKIRTEEEVIARIEAEEQEKKERQKALRDSEEAAE